MEGNEGKLVILVLGASSKIGMATIHELSSAKYACTIELRAGMRSPAKATVPAGVTVVRAEMGDRKQLAGVMKGVDGLLIVTPAVENRAPLCVATAEAAKEGGVQHVVALSNPKSASTIPTIFAKQYTELEQSISELGIPFTFLQLPFFIDNYLKFKDDIIKKSSISSPLDPDKPFTSVAVSDIAKVAAKVLANPSQHANKTYNIVSDSHTLGDVTRELSAALEREINYIRMSYETGKKDLVRMGFPEWQADGILVLYKAIDAGSSATNQLEDLGTYEEITGEKPTDLKMWVCSVAAGFK